VFIFFYFLFFIYIGNKNNNILQFDITLNNETSGLENSFHICGMASMYFSRILGTFKGCYLVPNQPLYYGAQEALNHKNRKKKPSWIMLQCFLLVLQKFLTYFPNHIYIF